MRIIRGSSIITADRHEVEQAVHWDDSSGSDFFFEPDAAQISGTGNAEDLSDVGWTTTGLSGQFVGGTAADFLSTSDKGVPAHYVTTAAGDIFQSPAIFGDHVHSHQAEHHLGTTPTELHAHFWGTFSVESNNETATGFGWVVNGGSVITAGDAIAMIVSDGSNFICRSSADSSTGAVVDTNLHEFAIIISQGTTDAIEWRIDDVSQGTLDLRTDVFPAAWGAGVQSAGSNRLLIGACRVFYR